MIMHDVRRSDQLAVPQLSKRPYNSLRLVESLYAVIQPGKQMGVHVGGERRSRVKTFLFQPIQHLYLQNRFEFATLVFFVVPIPIAFPVADGHGIEERGDIVKLVYIDNTLQVMKEF